MARKAEFCMGMYSVFYCVEKVWWALCGNERRKRMITALYYNVLRYTDVSCSTQIKCTYCMERPYASHQCAVVCSADACLCVWLYCSVSPNVILIIILWGTMSSFDICILLNRDTPMHNVELLGFKSHSYTIRHTRLNSKEIVTRIGCTTATHYGTTQFIATNTIRAMENVDSRTRISILLSAQFNAEKWRANWNELIQCIPGNTR